MNMFLLAKPFTDVRELDISKTICSLRNDLLLFEGNYRDLKTLKSGQVQSKVIIKGTNLVLMLL